MAAGELTIGSWIQLGHPSIGEVLGSAGFDWLVIDLEHSVITLPEAQALMTAIAPTGAATIVRLSSNDPVQIKRVMDAGATGVMVPNVRSAAEARAAVEAVHYPPRGTRGVGLARAQGYGAGTGFAAYRDALADTAVVIVMIEHVDAVEAIDDILAVEGVDGWVVGPYDLSGSLGIPGALDDARVTGLLERVREAGERAGTPGGLHQVEPDPAALEALVARGFRFLGYGTDARFLDVTARRDLARLQRGG